MESKSIKGTQTEKNLLKSFAGESQAKNRYTFFAKIAKKEGFEQISAFFMETAIQEQSHAKIFFGFLEGGELEITASYPAGRLGTTKENLLAAATGEHEEWTSIYTKFAEVAKEEGFAKIASKFKLIATVEAEHEKRFRKLLKNLEESKVFKSDKSEKWVCRECGYIHEGDHAPNNCPCCEHPQAYFEIQSENY
jgi:rubrerythrin